MRATDESDTVKQPHHRDDGTANNDQEKTGRRRNVSRRSFVKGAALGAGFAATDIGFLNELGHAVSNTILIENQPSGSTGWDLSYVDNSIEGFTTEFSVNIGESVDFKISTPSTHYRIDIYRIGWYGGAGARKQTSIVRQFAVAQVQPAPLRDAALGLVDCGNWAISASWPVPDDAVSGVYVANFVRLDIPGSPANRALFVVRDDDRDSDILLQTSDTTSQAYNRWGGNSLYHGDEFATFGHAVKVSYNRPMEPGQLENDFFYAEMPLVRWLERNGYDVAYTTNVDTERRPQQLLGHKVFVSSGHDEYWSATMRANVEAARDAGVHLIFMTGNEIFWKVRWESSIDGSGTPYRTLVCYKETLHDAKVDPSTEWTGTWRDGRFSPPSNGGRPENELTGTLFKGIVSVDATDFAIEVPHEYSRLRFWRHTSITALTPGTKATLTNATLGYEFNTDGDLPNRPAGLIRLSETTPTIDEVLRDHGKTYTPGPLTHHMTMYRAASGALVWSTGTVQWSWGLDSYHTNRPVFDVPVDPRIQQATLNTLADMGVQPASRQSDLTAATASSDTLAPASAISTPIPGSDLMIGTAVTLVGTATDAGGGHIAAVEVSTDGGTRWHPAVGREAWTYTFVPLALGTVNIKVRATDDSCNTEPITAGFDYTAVPRQLPGSLWNAVITPTVVETNDATPLELGVRFQSSIDAFVTGIRFYKGPGNTGPHIGRVWSSNGTLRATASFTDETASGWQQASFVTPVALSANTTYVASYTAPVGRYAADVNYFETDYALEPLSVPANGNGGVNGVYSTTPGSFPTRTFGATNYWVDPIVDIDDDRAPTVITTTPGSNVSQVGTTSAISATFDDAVVAESIEITVSSAAGPIAGTLSYDAATATSTFVAELALEPLTEHVATVVAATAQSGTPLTQPYSWNFTTVGPDGSVPTSIWSGDVVPTTTAANDLNAAELGLKFRSSDDGFVTGIRFYKGHGNTGTHVGHLWTATGKLLAAVTFLDESLIGWQEATFDTPVPITAGQILVASYLAPVGRYAVDGGQLNGSSIRRGPLEAIDGATVNGNGVYRYGPDGGFPASSYANSNYWVDVVFTRPPDMRLPAVASTTPAANLHGVATTAPISVRFDTAIDPATVAFTLHLGAGTDSAPLAGTITHDPVLHVLTFSPAAPLDAGATYTSAVATIGNVGAVTGQGHAWSFTAATPVGTTPATLWDTSVIPAVPAADDASAVELGVKFRVDVNGAVAAIRFFKGPGNIGPHIGHLWTTTGESLGTAVFTTESDGGWQQANFATPIPVSAGVTYVASYHAPAGRYAVTGNGFQRSTDRAPLRAIANGTDGGNGVFAYGAGGYPAASYGQSNYWVDVVFVGTIEPTITSTIPGTNATAVAVDRNLAATFSEHIDSTSAVFALRDSYGATVTGASSYDEPTRTIWFTPDSPLAAGAVYTATVDGARNSLGNEMAGPHSWAFSTEGNTGGNTGVNLFGDTVPSTESAADTGALEVGMRFRSTVAGRLDGMRFFKGPLNGGVHVGHLWTTTGVLLATAYFMNESASGWQYAPFDIAVDIEANNDHVVSYQAPQGGYAATLSYFEQGDVTVGPLVGVASSSETPNGLYVYASGGGFPTSSWKSANYWVDVEFTPLT
jgi:hypothetical protein